MFESQNIIDQIENNVSSICNECEGIIYYPPQDYRDSSIRIINATMILFNDAVRIARGKEECGIKTKLSISQIKDILQKMHIIMQKTTVISQKEYEIEKLFKDVKLNPYEFLILNDWNGDFMENVNI